MLRAGVIGNRTLKCLYGRAGGQPVRTKRLNHLPDVVFINPLAAVG
jgi:hypothetical protein